MKRWGCGGNAAGGGAPAGGADGGYGEQSDRCAGGDDCKVPETFRRERRAPAEARGALEAAADRVAGVEVAAEGAWRRGRGSSADRAGGGSGGAKEGSGFGGWRESGEERARRVTQ